MNFHQIKLLALALFALFAISCKCTKYGCQVPCNTNDGKTVRYVFGAYYNTEGKLTYKLFVSDSIYTAQAKADFEAFKGAILNNKLK